MKRGVTKPWAFLAYIAGDNNLSDAGLEDIEELCQTGASEQVHAAVQIDTYGEHDGSVRYEISERDWQGAAHRVVIQRLKESDSGNPRVLRNFLAWGFERYSANKYLAVVWNHGSGFRSVRRDIGYDDFGNSMDMPEVLEALKRAGITPEKKLALLGFDACLMNMLEIAHHFAQHAEVLVGSQQTEPGDGWPYDVVLAKLHDNPSPADLGRAIVAAYIADYKENAVVDVTQSAIDLSKTEAVVQALSSFGDTLGGLLPEARAATRAARLAVQSYEYADYVDLVHLTEVIRGKLPAAASAAATLRAAALDSVIVSGHYGENVRNSNGLSVWFPTNQQQYGEYRAKYLQLRCNAGHSGWVQFLDSYYA
jgi:hypothetical protein